MAPLPQKKAKTSRMKLQSLKSNFKDLINDCLRACDIGEGGVFGLDLKKIKTKRNAKVVAPASTAINRVT